jgi:thiol-disulfide isomerase/thioredoxin
MSSPVEQRIARQLGVGPGMADLPFEGSLPAFDGAGAWLNSNPLTPTGLRGRVVLVQFWTYTCINWLRTHPYVRAWAHRYRDHGLTVVGVHTPEFEFEHDLDNVRRAIKVRGIDWPVATDNDFRVWRAFANHYWPALYFVDADGRIRHHRFGEGDYERSEMVIQRLLAGAGGAGVPMGLSAVDATGAEVEADWVDLRSPESYLGTDQAVGFQASGVERLALNQWGLSGNWAVRRDAIALNASNGTIAFQFHARDVHLVMGPARGGEPVRFRVALDGKVAREAHGSDVAEDGTGIAAEQRMYQLVRQPEPIRDRRFEIEFLDAGVEAFVFTFG